MDLRQLAALVAVADHGTFSAAADALATVQSNISTHIRRLERELGATLVDRHGARLTEEGEAVVERARRVQAELDALVSDVAALQHDVSGRVRAGIIGTTARWMVPPLIEEMAARHPRVELEIVDATSTSLEPQLLSGRLELLIVNLPVPSPDIVTEPLFDEDLLLFVPADHPAASAAEARLDDIVDLPLFLPPPGTAFRELVDRAAVIEGVTLKARAELDGIRMLASMAISGQGAAIVPATAIPEDLQAKTRPANVKSLPRREVGIALRRRALPSAPARAFLDVVRDLVVDDRHRPEHVHPRAADVPITSSARRPPPGTP